MIPATPSSLSPHRADDPGNDRAMRHGTLVKRLALCGNRRAVVVDKIVAVYVVDPPVAVVIDSVARNLRIVHPDVFFQVRMIQIDPGIQHRHNDAPVAGVCIPCGVGIDVLQIPLLINKFIVGRERQNGQRPSSPKTKITPVNHERANDSS